MWQYTQGIKLIPEQFGFVARTVVLILVGILWKDLFGNVIIQGDVIRGYEYC
jgi:hypothetical protein